MGILHYGVRRGCSPVLDNFGLENSGNGIYFCWEISVIGTYFHLEFSGTRVYCYTQNSGNGSCMKVQRDNFSSNTCSVSGEQISRIFVLKNVLRSEPRSNGHLGSKFSFPALSPLSFWRRIVFVTFESSRIGYQYPTYILGLGINIGPNFWGWVVAEILAAHTPACIYSEVPSRRGE